MGFGLANERFLDILSVSPICQIGVTPSLIIQGVRRNSLSPEVILSGSGAEVSLTLTENDQELHRFFDRVRVAGRIVVQAGEHEFVVERRPTIITDEARRLLARGGPED